MLSDDSSSESETGRFKDRSKNQDERKKSSNQKEDGFRPTVRGRPTDNERFRREFERKRDDRDFFHRQPRERHRYSRHSPVRRRPSRERSPNRSREQDRFKPSGDSRPKSKPRDHRSNSRDQGRHSTSRSHKSPEFRKVVKDESKRTVKDDIKHILPPTERRVEKFERKSSPLKEKRVEKFDRKSRDKSSSPEYRGKRSVIQKPLPTETQKKRSVSPVVIEDHVDSHSSEEVQPGSYYSMIPAVVKEKSEESSEIDSSDDERLRAKLLNLEKELHKTRKKKHKKKHKRKSKSSKERDRDPSAVEVSSTTDIDKVKDDEAVTQIEIVEVTSTQKSNQKESSEEGEISSDDDSQEVIEIDSSDLRHKLKRSVPIASKDVKSKSGKSGPVLPPHLEKDRQSASHGTEGPALPPHLKTKSRNIGPTIPEDLRKVLAETDREIIRFESSDEDIGYGPLPTGAEDKWSEAHQRLEERALDMKLRKLDGHSLHHTKVKSREQWMLELPEGKAKYLGLEARSFRAKEGPDMSDRSSWTDTPEEKARKAAGIEREDDADVVLLRDARARHVASRDEEQEKAAKKHKKKHKREESLLELHQKKLKKKKKKDEKDEDKKERRPFSRDVDLQVNRFDEAQKKSIIKKAQDLNTRFGRGEAKYL